ncbi:hypothetical protein Tco_0182988, partial [Tanacetum coccineum]
DQKRLTTELVLSLTQTGTPYSEDETLVSEPPCHDSGHEVGNFEYAHKVFDEMREQDSKIDIIDKGDVDGFGLKWYTGVARKDVNQVENNKYIENLVFEDVNEEKNIVAQVVTDSPKIVISALAGVEHYQTTKVTGYFEINKQNVLWDTVKMQDFYQYLEVKKDSKDGQKDISLLAKIENIEGMEKTNIEVLKNHKRKGKLSRVMGVAEFFEWKPGLELWLVDKGRKIQHGLNEHGVADIVRKGLSM